VKQTVSLFSKKIKIEKALVFTILHRRVKKIIFKPVQCCGKITIKKEDMMKIK